MIRSTEDDRLEMLGRSADILAAHVVMTDESHGLPHTEMLVHPVVAAVIERSRKVGGISINTVVTRIIALATNRLQESPEQIHQLADALGDSPDIREIPIHLETAIASSLEDECAEHAHDGGAFLTALMVALAFELRGA